MIDLQRLRAFASASCQFTLTGIKRSLAAVTACEALQPNADRIEEAFILGSVVKGTDTGTSNIDVMVIGTVPQLELFDATIQLQGKQTTALQRLRTVAC